MCRGSFCFIHTQFHMPWFAMEACFTDMETEFMGYSHPGEETGTKTRLHLSFVETKGGIKDNSMFVGSTY